MSGEQSTLWPAESLASLSVWPGSREAQQMTATSGQKLLASLPSCDRKLSWLRTLVASSAWRSTMCLLTWQHRVTPQGRSYYLLRASVPPIEEIGFGLLPTINANDGGSEETHRQIGTRKKLLYHARHGEMWPTPRHEGFDAGAHRGKPDSLHSAVKMLHAPTSTANQLAPSMRDRDRGSWFPTPDAGMVQGGRTLPEGTSPTGMTPDGKKRQVGLTNAVKMLPTPTAHDHKDTGAPSESDRNSPGLAYHAGAANAQTGMKLNPAWVSRMMGFPDGWLSLDVPNTIALLAQGRALQDWAWREDGMKVRVFQIQGQPWQEVTRKTRAGRATP